MPKIIRLKQELRKTISEFKLKGLTVGLVPTMGALHEGHTSLVQMSGKQYDVTVVSIFINPVQFNNKEDLAKYPRNEQRDLDILEEVGCDIVFIPSEDEIYKTEPVIKINFGHLESVMEGKFRPGHFSGVGLIVGKLLGILQPDGAYFGQKDLQQFRVIATLVQDLDIPVNLHMAPIVREKDGLALSSRNTRLTKEQKFSANNLYKALEMASVVLKTGLPIKETQKKVAKFLDGINDIKLEYFEIVDFETLENISSINEGDRLALCIAGYVAGVRLIDNIIIEG